MSAQALSILLSNRKPNRTAGDTAVHDLPQPKMERFIGNPFGPNGICKLEEQRKSRRLRRARLVSAIERDVAVLTAHATSYPGDAYRTPSAVRVYRVLVRCALLIHVHVDIVRPHDPSLEERVAAMPRLPADGDLRRKATYRMMVDIAIRSGTGPEGHPWPPLCIDSSTRCRHSQTITGRLWSARPHVSLRQITIVLAV